MASNQTREFLQRKVRVENGVWKQPVRTSRQSSFTSSLSSLVVFYHNPVPVLRPDVLCNILRPHHSL